MCSMPGGKEYAWPRRPPLTRTGRPELTLRVRPGDASSGFPVHGRTAGTEHGVGSHSNGRSSANSQGAAGVGLWGRPQVPPPVGECPGNGDVPQRQGRGLRLSLGPCWRLGPGLSRRTRSAVGSAGLSSACARSRVSSLPQHLILVGLFPPVHGALFCSPCNTEPLCLLRPSQGVVAPLSRWDGPNDARFRGRFGHCPACRVPDSAASLCLPAAHGAPSQCGAP